MRQIIRRSAWPLGLLIALTVGVDGFLAYASESPEREVRMGREAAAEVEGEHKVVSDPKVVTRVNTVGQEVARIANSLATDASYGSAEVSHFEYRFKVLEDDDVNAFSLPGGYIYVNTGLLDYIQSDHELAGVLAHEAAHSAHHHMVYLLKEQSRMDGRIAVVLLAGMLTGVDTGDLGNILIGAQLVKIARASGYGQKAEIDADRTAVDYLAKTNYNPVGLATFIERLARDYATKPQIDMGILLTHPPSRQRARNVIERIVSLGLPINRRAVVSAVKAQAEPGLVNGQAIARVKLGDKVLFEPAPIGDLVTSEQRAEIIVTKVNQLLDSQPQLREIRLSPDKYAVLARGEPIIVVTNADAELQQKAPEELAGQAAHLLKQIVWQEFVDRIY